MQLIRFIFIVAASVAFCATVQAQRFIKTFDTVNQMREARLNDVHTNAFVAGYTTVNDGGGGFFVYHSGSATATNLGTVFAPTNGVGRWLRSYSGPLDVKWFGAKGDGSNQDYESLTNAVAVAASAGKLYFPPGTYKITNAISIPDSSRLEGAAGGQTVINVVGDFRGFSMLGVTNDYVEDVTINQFKFTFSGGAANQCAVRFYYARDCLLENVEINAPTLNGVEVDSSIRVTSRKIQIVSPSVYGYFVYNSEDCDDHDVYVYQPGSLGHEFKNCVRSTSYKLKVIEPGQYGAYIWTGNDGAAFPGGKLSRYNGYVDPYILGKTNCQHLLLIDSSPDCFAINPVVKQASGAWAPLQASGTSFFNEVLAMTCTTTSGSSNITAIVNISQLAVGDRIHVGNITGNYTITNISGTTATVSATLPTSSTTNVIGWVSTSSGAFISNPQVGCQQSGAGIVLAGTTNDPIRNVVLTGGIVTNAATHGVYLSYAEGARINSLFVSNTTEEAISIRDQSQVMIEGVVLKNKTTIGTDAITIYDSCEVSISNSDIADFLGTGVNISSTNGRVAMVGGRIFNCNNLAAVIKGESSLTGVLISSSRITAASLNEQVQVHGSQNSITGCIFLPGASTNLDAHISEATGATGNIYGNNAYGGNFATDVTFDSAASVGKIQSLAVNRVLVYAGTNSPESVVTAPVGSLFLRTDGGAGTSLYTKTNGTGNTGWSAR